MKFVGSIFFLLLFISLVYYGPSIMDVINVSFLFHFVFINSFKCVPFEQLAWAAHRKRNRCYLMSSAQRMEGKTIEKNKMEREREKKMEIKLDSIKLKMIVYLICVSLFLCVCVCVWFFPPITIKAGQASALQCIIEMLVNNRCCYMLIVFKPFAMRSMTAFKSLKNNWK